MLGTDLITFHWGLLITAVLMASLYLCFTHTHPSAGLPLAPVELNVTGDSPHKLQLSWSPPFSLPGETIFYSLLIQDLATGLNRTVEPLSLTVFTHQLSEMEALACHSFIFSVFSLNEVGLSINSSSSTPVLHPAGEKQPYHTLYNTTHSYHCHTLRIDYRFTLKRYRNYSHITAR